MFKKIKYTKYVVEPMKGIEPPTPSLPWKCSTPELHWLLYNSKCFFTWYQEF